MSTPAGWYDDGSGRQRYWDGERWTEHFAPAQGAAVVDSSPNAEGLPQNLAAASPTRTGTPTLGFVGLGLAVVGTILVCIPTVATGITGMVLLLAALVFSLIALFKKGVAKWPAIVGAALSVVGGVIGIVVLSASLLLALVNVVGPNGGTSQAPPVTAQPTTPSDEATPPPTGESAGRPSPEAIGLGFQSLLHQGGMTEYDEMPGFFTCIGQHFYDSELSDETLQTIAEGTDVVGADRAMATAVGKEGATDCLAQQ